MSCRLPKEVSEYIHIVRSGEYQVCKDQLQLCDMVERIFKNENLFYNEAQAAEYLAYQKYFEYALFPWEKFCFVLHNCIYKSDGELRFPDLFILVGRGAGKNGYLAFEDFCLLTPTNGIKFYDIDLCANAEEQARRTFDDIYRVLEAHKAKMSKHFYWNQEKITNLKTQSTLRYRTSNAKTKDGGRPGKVDFDEKHQYENYAAIDVFTTGLGKIRHPRTTTTTTNGYVRGGPLDNDIAQAEQILSGEIDDNGTLPFLCRLESNEEIHDEANWHKANPSLRYFPELLRQMRKEYKQYLTDPSNNSSFMVKRMNRIQSNLSVAVTSWDNILATNRPIPDLSGYTCVAGIDYAKTTDFVSAGLLFNVEDVYYWMQHTWICTNCADLPKIKPPLRKWEELGLCTFVDAPEIAPDIPAGWLEEQGKIYNIAGVGIDLYRYTLLSKALKEVGFDADRKTGNITLIRKSTQMLVSPVINSAFACQRVVWGDDPMMRWYTNNACIATTADGNVRYEKIEPDSRKTDGFMAFVAAMAIADKIPDASSREFLEPIIIGF